MVRQIVPVFFTMDIPGYTRLLQREAWLRMSGDVARSAGLCHRRARPASDSLPLCRATHSQSGQISDELLDAYLFVEDADALYAEYAARTYSLLLSVREDRPCR